MKVKVAGLESLYDGKVLKVTLKGRGQEDFSNTIFLYVHPAEAERWAYGTEKDVLIGDTVELSAQEYIEQLQSTEEQERMEHAGESDAHPAGEQ